MGNMNFNPAQREAIMQIEGPCLVMAGPGSGKTAVLCERLHHMVENAGIRDEKILVITFTKAASIEMKERFLKRMAGSDKGNHITFGTFHAVFFDILKKAYGFRGDSILREEEKYLLVKNLISRLEEEVEEDSDLIKNVLGEISSVKNSGTDLSSYEAKTLTSKGFSTLFREYQRIIKEKKKLDFDDMLLQTHELLKRDPTILQKWQEKYQYLLVDEFQDINYLQFEVLKLLALPQNHLFVVGDDDQSIYGFRGSKPEIMLHFPDSFPNCRRILLNVNYRSCNRIVTNAISLINHNEKRFVKEIQAFSKKSGELSFLWAEDTVKEAERIGQDILLHHAELSYEDVAILFRSNSQMVIFLSKFEEMGIPFHSTGPKKNLYSHWIGQDLCAFLDLSAQCREGELLRRDLLQVMNRPNHFFLRESVGRERTSIADWKAYYEHQPQMRGRIDEFSMGLLMIDRLSAFSALNYIRKAMRYEDFLRDYAARRSQDVGEYLEIFDLYLDLAKRTGSKKAWMDKLQELANRKEEAEDDDKGVAFLTMHGSKGLEFQTVYIADVIESITPFRRASLAEEIEEERRLFYVAMTRAKEKLVFCLPGNYRNHEAKPSRFLMELEDTYSPSSKS